MKELYEIELIGSDDKTIITMLLSKNEAKLLKIISDESREVSFLRTMPIMFIKKLDGGND